MAANDPATILLRGLDWSIKGEAVSDAIITPGMLVERVGALVSPHGTAAGLSQKMFARRSIADAGGVDTDYASGDTVRFGFARSGDQVNAILNLGSSISDGDDLISDGIGGVKTAAAEEAELFVGKAIGAVSDPVSGIARVVVEVL